MYQAPIKTTSSKVVKSRLGLKIGAIFLGTFLAVFVGLLFFDLLLMLGERAIVEAATSNQTPATAIDPKLETDLAKVLEPAETQNTADIKNPFADTTGISDKFSAASALTANAARTNAAAPNVNPTSGQVTGKVAQTQQQNVAARTVQPNQTSVPQPQQDTRARMQLRDERIRLGQDGGPEAAVFAIDDLLPVGVVSGGDGKDEVMFFSESACRVVSFPVGTQFYDGWFDSLRQEGVVFGFYDRFRTMRMRAWGRSVEGCKQQSLLEQTSPNEALTTGGGD
ncbi:MAG TPA: hypothetical protein VIL74_00430 [Pyrinomonadaceae bacterium]|jgi:hypothetical protein